MKDSDSRTRSSAPAPAEALPEEESVRITGFASGGDGVGRLPDGRVVFVDGGIPGERVELLDIRKHKKVLRARAGRVLEASPDRVEPRCPHFGACGGCRWQHVSYSAQLDAKRQALVDALERIGKIEVHQAVEIVPSPETYGYRARARWVESEEGFGYRIRGSRIVSPVEVCPVLTGSAEAALGERVSERAARVATEAPGSSATTTKRRRAKEWVVTAGSEGSVIVARSSVGRPARAKREAPVSLSIKVNGESIRVSGESFVQGNALLWDALSEAVRAECTAAPLDPSKSRFVELYAGIGFFTLPIARVFAGGLALESDPSGLADLRFNLRRADLSKEVDVLAGRVETRGDLEARIGTGEVLLVDPPRIGLDVAVRAAIVAAGPPRVVYVSCDPATLARDLRELVAAGYAIASIRAFDLFPHTPHVETIVRLERPVGSESDGDPATK